MHPVARLMLASAIVTRSGIFSALYSLVDVNDWISVTTASPLAWAGMVYGIVFGTIYVFLYVAFVVAVVVGTRRAIRTLTLRLMAPHMCTADSLWGWVAAYTTPTVMTSYLAIQPLTAAVLGALLLGESLGLQQLFGAIGIACGLAIVIYARSKELRDEAAAKGAVVVTQHDEDRSIELELVDVVDTPRSESDQHERPQPQPQQQPQQPQQPQQQFDQVVDDR